MLAAGPICERNPFIPSISPAPNPFGRLLTGALLFYPADKGTEETKKKDTPAVCLSFGTAEGTRTPSIQNRNLTLYPIELRPHGVNL